MTGVSRQEDWAIEIRAAERWLDANPERTSSMQQHRYPAVIWDMREAIAAANVTGAELIGEPTAIALAALYRRGVLTRTMMPRPLTEAWMYSQYPNAVLRDEEWRALFDLCGYVDSWHHADPPAEPMMLYRGASESHRLGWAWTGSRTKATEFATDRYMRYQSTVWQTMAPPERILGHFADRGEDEYVLDTRGLLVERSPERQRL